MDHAALDFLIPLLQIVWIDVVLSDDNALVIAMAFHRLPQPQRRWGIALGSAAAALLRIVFTLLVWQVLAIPYIRIAGGLSLLWIAVRLAADETDGDAAAPTSVWAAIRLIVVADAIMSIDNVIAVAAAAKGSWALIVFGLVLSIPLVVIGASLMAPLMRRFPFLVWGGAGILGWVAGGLIASDPAASAFIGKYAPAIESWSLAAAGAALTLFGSWLNARRKDHARTIKA